MAPNEQDESMKPVMKVFLLVLLFLCVAPSYAETSSEEKEVVMLIKKMTIDKKRGFNLEVQPLLVAWCKELPRRRIPHEVF